MNKIVKIVKGIRTHWKKSTFAFICVGYGGKYAKEQYEINELMRHYCEEAALLGEAPTGNGSDSSQIAVILNPAANKRNAKKNFEKYCAPLLHLSGAYVTVIETSYEGHARKIPDELDPKTTAILVAGGDGTLSEALTGLMRSRSERLRVPLGVLPLGQYNTLASKLFGPGTSQVESMAAATMAVLRGKTRKLNAYRVETLDGDNDKAIYGLGWIEWGTWPWLKKRVKELWYWGPLRYYMPLLLPAENALKATVSASVAYTAPCGGCSRCYNQRPDLLASESQALMAQGGNRWWGVFVKKPQANSNSVNYKNLENEACSVIERKSICTTDLRLATDIVDGGSYYLKQSQSSFSPPPSLVVNIGGRGRYQGEFLNEGLKYLKGEDIGHTDVIHVKQVEVRPTNQTNEDNQDSKSSDVLLIDNEEFELRPIRVTILPNSLTVFCK